MTRMTKDETKLLAQAAVIVDSLLPWKKLPPLITDLPISENPVSAELFEALKKVRTAMDVGKSAEVWYNELTMYAHTPIKNEKYQQCKYIFQKAFAVIRNKERWTQGAYSRTTEVPKTYAFYYEPVDPMVVSENHGN